MTNIAKTTKNFRYKLAVILLKKLTPVLFNKIDKNLFNDNTPLLLRPSIIFMRDKFKKKLVRGVEIGVDKGINSKVILNELNIEKLYLIDPWENYEGNDKVWININENYKYVLKEFRENKNVQIIKDYSNYAVSFFKENSLDFVYIDGNHSYKFVYKDIDNWFSKVKEGGIIAGHDINLLSVLKAVKDFCFKRNINFNIEPRDWYFIKEVSN